MIFLPGGRASTSMPGGQHVVGVGEQQPALAAGEQRGEHLGELAFHVGVGLGEHLQDAVVDVGDDVEQILARRLDVLELGGQEVVALLQRGELLERQGVDPAQFGEFTFGLLGPALLGGPVERHRGGRGHLLAALLGLLVLGHLQLGRRQRHVGPVLGDQVGGGHAELLERLLLELLDAKRRLGLGDLVAVQRVGQRGDPGAELVDLGAHLGRAPRPGADVRRPAGRGCGRPPPRSLRASPRPAGPTPRPRPPPSRRAPGPRGHAVRAAAPPARPPPRGAANPPGHERHSRVPRRCAPPAGPRPRRRGRPRRRPTDS